MSFGVLLWQAEGVALGRRIWLVVAIVAVVAVVGALITRQVYRHGEASTAPVVLPSGVASTPPTGQAGAGVVRFTADAYDYPLQDQIRQLLQTYFDAINNRNYAQWRSVVTTSRIVEEPEQKWDVDYRSTQDVDIVVYRIDDSPQNERQVLLTFTSLQSANDAPADLPSSCINWQVVWPLSFENGGWKLDSGSTVAPVHTSC